MPRHNNPRNVLIVGGDSLLGDALGERFSGHGCNCVFTTRRQEFVVAGKQEFLDLEKDVTNLVPPQGGGVAFFCAAITSLAVCRAEPERTRLVNVTQTLQLAKRLKKYGYRFVFLSTNLVFDGKDPLPKPQDPSNPATEYGRQKAEDERSLLAMAVDTLVVRITKVVTQDHLLFKNWIRDFKNEKFVNAFEDMYLAPISINAVVSAIEGLTLRNARGIWHISPPQEFSYVQFACDIANSLGKSEDLVRAITADGIVPQEERPRHPALDATRTENFLGVKFRLFRFPRIPNE